MLTIGHNGHPFLLIWDSPYNLRGTNVFSFNAACISSAHPVAFINLITVLSTLLVAASLCKLGWGSSGIERSSLGEAKEVRGGILQIIKNCAAP